MLTTGSLAYDHLMQFDGVFKDHIFADRLDHLSVSFLAKREQIYFGGCGGNIAFGLKLLGVEPRLIGLAGNDFEKYEKWLNENEIDASCVTVDPDDKTTCAYILSDQSESQIAMFAPGALLNYEGEIKFDESETFDFVMLSPQLPKRMMELGEKFQKLGWKYLFDPGQALVSLTAEETEFLLLGANALIVNEYELEMIQRKLQINLDELRLLVDFLVVTLGDSGAEIYSEGKHEKAPGVSDLQILDATGCGDAFRAGFIAAKLQGKDFVEALRHGNVTASFCLEAKGPQGYKFTSDGFCERYDKNYA